MIKPIYLRSEYLVNPLGIDVLEPRLSWVLESEERNQKQSAYQILVASSENLLKNDRGDLWDSKKVDSDQTNHIIYAGTPLKSQMVCFWKVRVWDGDGNPSEWSDIAMWSMGLLSPTDWKAKWIGPPKKRFLFRRLRRFFRKKNIDPSPLLRKSFNLKEKIKRAIVFVTALGEYELYLNGKRVGDHILAPEWTDYHKRIQYQTYDVTNLLQEGENVIGAVLADGWYIGNTGIIAGSRIWGNDRRFIFQMVIEYADGRREEIISDNTWKIYKDGPIRRADHYLGEIYDARKEQPGWDMPGFDDSAWQSVTVDETIRANLVAQMNEPIRIVHEIKPISISEPVPGVFIFNLGQNIAGWCKIRLNPSICDPGQPIKLRHGEMLKPDGTLYTKNLRFAKATDVFIYDGSEEREFHPHFTYHGFQYVEVTGLKEGVKPPLDLITGCVICSDAPLVGSFESSDSTLNKLWQNILWTQRDNLHSIPTDCPQRDERLGWMGDAQIFCQTSIFNMDMAAFYTKWLQDIRDAQFHDGQYSDYAPNPTRKLGITWTKNAPGWADCALIIPWLVYLNYNDKQILRTHYCSAKKFIDHVHHKNRNLLWKKHAGFLFLTSYGDWLNGDKIKVEGYPKKGAAMPKDVFATAYFANSTRILAKMAKALALYDDYKYYSNLAEKIQGAFIKKFVTPDGRIKGNTQSTYAFALYFNLLPEELKPKAIEYLLEALKKYDMRLSTGFCSTLPMMLELTKWGYNDVAYSLLLSKRFPSWFYMIEQGATTIWERWDSYIPERGFQSKLMTSFNHFAFGSIGEWIYRIILGINPDETQPGYKHFLIKPQPGGSLTLAKGHYISIHGKIAVEWHLKEKRFELKVIIPPNTTATVHIPAGSPDDVTESDKPIQEVKEIEFLSFNDNIAQYRLPSGIYVFSSKLPI
ncbi:MAG: glycoside hydrolase family 78 protein [Candidatus Helarchaeota archaeon]